MAEFLLAVPYALGNLFKFSVFSPEIRFSLLDISVFLIAAVNFRIQKILLPFALIALSSLFISGSRYGQTAVLVGFLYLFRWIVYSSAFFKNPQKIILWLITITTVVGLVQYTLYPDVRLLEVAEWDPHYYRLVGQFLDPGFTGLILVFGLTYLTINSHRLKNLLWGLTYVAFILTYSRSSYLAFVAAMSYVAWQRRSWKFLAKALALLAVSVALLPRPGGEGVKLERTSSTNARLINWSRSVTIFRDHPVLGVGFNVYRYAQKEYGFLDDSKWLKSHAGAGADSSLLFVAATTGTIGLLAYLLYLRQLYKLNALRYFLIPLLVHSLLLNSLFYPPVLLWLSLIKSIKNTSP